MTTSRSKTSERRIKAAPVSRGVGIGQIVFLTPNSTRVQRGDIDDSQIETEIARFHLAIDAAKLKINRLAREQNSTGAVFGAHLLIVDESSFITEIENAIRMRRVTAEWAVRLIAEHKRKRQSSVEGESFREKAADIADVADRIISELSGASPGEWAAPPESIVVARELRPSNVVLIAKSFPAAIITERGGWTSHASIIARDLKIPMISGVHDIESAFAEHDNAIVDALGGEIIVDPDIDTIEKFRTIAIERAAPEDRSTASRNSCITRDGTEIAIRANAESHTAYRTARATGARGIGLFRSESLIQTPGQIPTEDEQLEAYSAIADAVGEDGVKIRTFDIGVAQFSAAEVTAENNPSLGLKSIRLSLSNEEYFRTQIRTLLRASAESAQIEILLPMITGLDEIWRTRSLIESECDALSEKGIPFGQPRLGVMIEVPSAVMTAPEIAQNVDFLCLGTNDLVQYLLAVDRDNESVADLYQTLHPAVFRAIKFVISAADEAGKSLIVCGEMAGSAFYVPLLIGAGARELSMNVSSIQNVRKLISGITIEDAERLLEHVMHCKTGDTAEATLREYYVENWADLFPPDLLNAKHR